MMKSCDVVVVGAGVMGCSIAHHLAAQGAEVVVIDRLSQVGAGSTGLCSGGVRHQFSHPLNVELSIASLKKLEAFEAEFGQAIDFHRDGYLFLLTSPDLVDRYRKSVAMQQSLGVESKLIDVDEIERLTPPLNLDDVLAGAYCSRDGVVDPHGVTEGYARAARSSGAKFVLDTEVVDIDTESGTVQGVRVADERYSAPCVVNAAGPWSAAVGEMASVTIPVQPFPRYVWVTRAFEDAPRRWTMVIDAATSFYFHREGDGVLMGMGEADETPSFDDTVDWEFLPRLSEVAAARYPALAESSVLAAWCGLYEVTPDHNPILGEAPNLRGFYLATGFSGHGFMHGPIIGEIMADQILGNRPTIDVAPFGLSRFDQDRAAGEQNVV